MNCEISSTRSEKLTFFFFFSSYTDSYLSALLKVITARIALHPGRHPTPKLRWYTLGIVSSGISALYCHQALKLLHV